MPFTGFSIREGQDTREAQRPAWQLEETCLLGFGSQGLSSSKIYTGIGIWANEREVIHVIGGVNAPQGRRRKTALWSYCCTDLGCPYNDHRGKKQHKD